MHAMHNIHLHHILLQFSMIASAKTPQNKNSLVIRTVAVDLYSGCDILESLRRQTNKKDFVMTTLNSNFGMEYAPTPFMLRFGRREMLVTRDVR